MSDLAARLLRGDRRTVGDSPTVADDVAAEPALLPELVECLVHPDAGVRMRAADALERVTRTDPRAVDPFVDRLLDEAAVAEQAEVRWHLAQILPRLTLDEARRWRAAGLMTQWFERAESRIVRTSALQAMVDLADGYGPLRDVAAEMMRRALDSGVPSLAARARRILKPLRVDRQMLDAVLKPAEPPMPLTLTLLPGTLAVCRLPPGGGVPAWVNWGDPLVAVIRTADEVSVVCADARVPDGVQAERGWRAFKVEGPLDFALTGILARLTAPLAEAAIPVFALSTYDTDYLLVRADKADHAAVALEAVGRINRQPT
ncbi:ACT domain-containing protein [Azospirillum halopraeferens]|uniref:ACT domain-containing protein n=1 Tax=Azospirillum halopraeferens TaxID=34010 RepID=UPI00041DDA1D|nr:ACT domain-containing protein [Azospirillum halopraeferens]